MKLTLRENSEHLGRFYVFVVEPNVDRFGSGVFFLSRLSLTKKVIIFLVFNWPKREIPWYCLNCRLGGASCKPHFCIICRFLHELHLQCMHCTCKWCRETEGIVKVGFTWSITPNGKLKNIMLFSSLQEASPQMGNYRISETGEIIFSKKTVSFLYSFLVIPGINCRKSYS